MAIGYAMLFTTNRTKQECIHIHVLELVMSKDETKERE